jgi:hypothetical protein
MIAMESYGDTPCGDQLSACPSAYNRKTCTVIKSSTVIDAFDKAILMILVEGDEVGKGDVGTEVGRGEVLGTCVGDDEGQEVGLEVVKVVGSLVGANSYR